MWHNFDVNSCQRQWSKVLQEIQLFHDFNQIFSGDWITSVCACTSDRERSTRTSHTLVRMIRTVTRTGTRINVNAASRPVHTGDKLSPKL